jgi:hypothetical protein
MSGRRRCQDHGINVASLQGFIEPWVQIQLVLARDLLILFGARPRCSSNESNLIAALNGIEERASPPT